MILFIVSDFQNMILASGNLEELKYAFSCIKGHVEDGDICPGYYQELRDCLTPTVLQRSSVLAQDASGERMAKLIESACQEILSFLEELLLENNQVRLFGQWHCRIITSFN